MVLDMRKRVSYPIIVRVSLGTYFVSHRGLEADMVATAEFKERLTGNPMNRSRSRGIFLLFPLFSHTHFLCSRTNLVSSLLGGGKCVSHLFAFGQRDYAAN